jgi:hypothetical protein
MKKSHSGTKVLLWLLIGVPVIVDLFLLPLSFWANTKVPMSLTAFLVISYLAYLPLYLVYLLVAYLINVSNKKYKGKRFPAPKE